MNAFIMNGERITSNALFRKNFDPVEFLRCRKSAAAFALREIAPLSEWYRIHAETLYHSVYDDWKSECYSSDMSSPKEYFTPMWVSGIRNTRTRREVLKKYAGHTDDSTYNNEVMHVLENVWNTVKKSDILGSEFKGMERDRIFCILASGCFLAEKDGLSKKSLFDSIKLEDEFTVLSDVFESRAKPYRLIVDPNPSQRPETGKPLTLKKLTAGANVFGNTSQPLILELYASGESKKPYHTETIEQGDYRYFTVLDGKPVFLHPTVSMSKDGYMAARVRNMIDFSANGKVIKSVPAPKNTAHIACAGADGFAVVTGNGSIDATNYAFYRRLGQFAGFGTFVELEFALGTMISLSSSGDVRTSDGRRTENRQVTLKKIISSNKKGED